MVVLVAVALACAHWLGHDPTCPRSGRVERSRIVVHDGDTILIDGHPVRILGIDTPETRSPSVGILEDQPFGRAATESTRAWIDRARVIEIRCDGRDPYGRRLAHVLLDGELLAVRLVRARLAYETVSHYGDNGFPEYADRILEAWEQTPRPPFEAPWKWRRKHQRRRARSR